MKNISTNKLQSDLSRVIKNVESGEVYQVQRYSKPVAYLVSKEKFGEIIEGKGCQKCVEEIKEIVKSKFQNPNA